MDDQHAERTRNRILAMPIAGAISWTAIGIAGAVSVLSSLACAEDLRNETLVSEADGSLIEFRLAHDTAGPGLDRVRYEGGVLYLDSSAVASDTDLRVVRPSIRGDRLLLQLEFTAEGARRLEHVTGENIGERMAVLLEGRVRSAPVIRSPVGGADASIAVGVELSDDEAERLAARIRARWPEDARSS